MHKLQFFKDANQIVIPHNIVIQLVNEGIDSVDDLADFENNNISQVTENLRRSGGLLSDLNQVTAVGATIPTPSCIFKVTSHKRMLLTCELTYFYGTIERIQTTATLK